MLVIANSAETWFYLGLSVAVKGFIILGVTGLVVLFLRKASASLRYSILLMAMTSLIALPFLSAVLPNWFVLPVWSQVEGPTQSQSAFEILNPMSDRRSENEYGVDATSAKALQAMTYESLDVSTNKTDGPSSAVVPLEVSGIAPNESGNTVYAWILAVWALGAFLISMALVLGRISIRRIERRSQKITNHAWESKISHLCTVLGVARPIQLILSPQPLMPMVWGVFKIRLLLPKDAERWPEDRLRLVLLHELAHVKRNDYFTHLFTSCVCALYWFNPLVWWARHQMTLDREHACDDLVLDQGSHPADYADELLHVVAGLQPYTPHGSAAIAMARSSRLELRLKQILDVNINRRFTRRSLLACLTMVAGIVLPVATMRSVRAVEYTPLPQAIRQDLPKTKLTYQRDETEKLDFIVTLNNGVTVELLGICEHPSFGKQWWMPNGDLLEEAPYDDEPFGRAFPKWGEKGYKFGVRISGLADKAFDYCVMPQKFQQTQGNRGYRPSEKNGNKNAKYVNGSLDEIIIAIGASFVEEMVDCDFTAGVCSGDWKDEYRYEDDKPNDVVEWTRFKNVSLRPNFNPEAQFDEKTQIIRQSEDQARLLNHEYIGTEHILLALVVEHTGSVSEILKEFGITREQVYNEVLRMVKRNNRVVFKRTLPMTDRAKSALENADQLAKESGNDIVNSQHVLLGLLQTEKGVAAQVLVNLGLNLERTHKAITNQSSQESKKKTDNGVPLRTSEYSGNPELLRLVAESSQRNQDRLVTWKCEADIVDSSFDSIGFRQKMSKKALFVWDRDQASLRYRTDLIKKQLREPLRSDEPKFWAGMKTPKMYFEYNENGIQNLGVVFPNESMPTGSLQHDFNPFDYLMVKKVDGVIKNWGNPKKPDDQKLSFKTNVFRLDGQDIIVEETTWYQNDESAYFRKEYDLTKGGYLTTDILRSTSDNSLRTIIYDYKRIKGVWVPHAYTKKFVFQDEANKLTRRSSEVITFTRHVINEPIDSDEFALDEQGMYANDRINNDDKYTEAIKTVPSVGPGEKYRETKKVDLPKLQTWPRPQAGLVTPQQGMGPMISVVDTIEGREYIVSAKIDEDGKFKNSITLGNRTQTISGQVVNSDDNYAVTVQYKSAKVGVPGLKSVNSTTHLKKGESRIIGGVGNDMVYVMISNL